MKTPRTHVLTLACLTAVLIIFLWFAVVGAAGQQAVKVKQLVASAIPKSLKRAAQTSESPWQIECVYCPHRFSTLTERAIRIDANDHPHIAYGEKNLYYAWFDGSKWIKEIVDTTNKADAGAAIALDSEGYPHISYLADPHEQDELRYAFLDASGWQTATIDTGLEKYGYHTSIDVDQENRPHISYHPSLSSTRELRYATLEATGWQTETVDTNAGWSSLALDASGRPHIGYSGSSGIGYAHFDGTGWHTQTVDSTEGSQVSLALDQAGNPHVAYSSGSLIYAFLENSTWITQTAVVHKYNISHKSLVLSSDGRPSISYIPGSFGERSVQLAHLTGTVWHTETIDSYSTTYYGSSSLAIDKQDKLHIAYITGIYDNFDLRYAPQNNGNWDIQVVDRSTIAVGPTSISLDQDNQPHISGANGYCALWSCPPLYAQYMYKDPTGWHTQTVETNARLFWYSAVLDLDQAGWPHMALATYDDLTYAHLEVSGWVTESIYGPCHYPSLALDSQDYAHISCEESIHGTVRIMYIRQIAPSLWTTQTVASGQVEWPSLALDSDDQPHISYRRYFTEDVDLLYARLEDNVWAHEIADDTGGSRSHLILDSNNRPHIIYDVGELRYATSDATGWLTKTLDTSIYWSRYRVSAFSIAVDKQGQPHVTYEDEDGSLKYAFLSPFGWQVRDVGDQYGFDSSLTMDMLGHPHISFIRNREILYAHLPITYTPQVYFPIIQISPGITITQ